MIQVSINRARVQIAYSGCWLKETNGPSCLGLAGFGVRLARETAFGSKLLYGCRDVSFGTGSYMKGCPPAIFGPVFGF
jgi:hypothetical protein